MKGGGTLEPQIYPPSKNFFCKFLARPPEQIWRVGEIIFIPSYRRMQDEKNLSDRFSKFLSWAELQASEVDLFFAFLRFLSSLACHISAVMKAAQVQLWRTIVSWEFYWSAKVRNSTVETAPATNGQTFENRQYWTNMRWRHFGPRINRRVS